MSAEATQLEKKTSSGFNPFEPIITFFKDSHDLINKCSKPDYKEFSKIAGATAMGFFIMGFVGFFVKLVHIPINNILVGGN